MKKLLAASSIFVTLFAGAMSPVFAADETNLTSGYTMSGAQLALHSYDVTSFFTGSPVLGDAQFEVVYNGAAYRFATQENLDAFKRSPENYLPQFGGFCALGAALGKKLDGDPKFWKVVDSKLYLNVTGPAQASWEKDIPGNLKTAYSKWEEIKATAADKL
jgi:YHS domain-containing protein